MTLMDNDKKFDDWDEFYKDNDTEKMPWYEKNLDLDLEDEIKSRQINSGQFLDLGTGPGTQAIELTKRGFSVTGSDLSIHAITKAQKLSNDVKFVADDILDSKLLDNQFDYILDRGCFHVFEKSHRPTYINQIKRILKKPGIVFLKCMSDQETNLPEDEGPHKMSKQEIVDTFSQHFEIEGIKPTVYYGTIRPLPKAWFVVLQNK